MNFTVPGKIEPKQRPRFFRRGIFTGVYTPTKTRKYEEKIAWHARAAGVKPVKGAVSLRIIAGFKLPKSLSKKEKHRRLMEGHTQRPDLDNIEKATMDALNGIAYLDDCQVTNKHTTKEWVEGDEKLAVIVRGEG